MLIKSKYKFIFFELEGINFVGDLGVVVFVFF